MATMADYIRYANQGATRNQPLDPKLVQALSFLPEMGITAEVFSGGQPAKGTSNARVGSVRHDHGNAGDMFFYKDGRKLNWANEADRPIFEDIVQRGKAAGITGWGAGPGYMQEGSMHVGFGNPGVWGAGGKGANAPEWLANAFNGKGVSIASRAAAQPPVPVPSGAPAPSLPPAVEVASAKVAEPAAAPAPEVPTPSIWDSLKDGDFKGAATAAGKNQNVMGGLAALAGAMGGGNNAAAQEAATITPSSVGADVASNNMQLNQGAQQLMAQIMASRMKPRGLSLMG